MKSGNQKSEGMIGLEIHVYLVTEKKLFCNCLNSREKGIKPNTNICPICTGQPGAKPLSPLKEAVEKATQIGIALGCSINEYLPWQRKHYSWPDLPKGYQNTLSGSAAEPLGVEGKFEGIRISSMHLEEDPASWEPDTGNIDYNRSGLPLVEIVTAPDFRNSKEVVEWLKKLVHALSYLKAVDPDAGIKVDVNVSIPKKTERVEIKNINSFESIERAIDYEIERQMNEGNKEKHTRRFDEKKGKTERMRSKEEAQDYRFILDPDLKPLVLKKDFIEGIIKKMPELPTVKISKFKKEYKLDDKALEILTQNVDIAEFFEDVISKGAQVNLAASWISVELLRVLNYHKSKLDSSKIKPEHFAALLKLLEDGKITPLKAKEMLNSFYPESKMPSAGEGKINDEKEIEKVALESIKENTKAAEDYKSGQSAALNFLLGDIMKRTKKRADYSLAKRVLERMLR